MNNFSKIIVVLALGLVLLSLSGCAGALPWNDQNAAGMEKWSVTYKDGAINKVQYINGKEAGASDIVIQLADGTVLNFTGSDIKAFQGQELRASVEKAIAEQLGSVSPGVIDAILKAISGGAS